MGLSRKGDGCQRRSFCPFLGTKCAVLGKGLILIKYVSHGKQYGWMKESNTLWFNF